ncbi:hypothetical protein MKK70_21210 [Methylobacterium sp. E-041]|uniref:hypothetical protein n=1 Tax=Methylobacterium sp. E-041 TaxID=2836573 RepID=UPI001FB9A9B4|nr:hypothetical protein [Methylobacterium sp. E-041]MCJ2107849.1 hypothetical protein [Methylobacterium sp. E-041]
MIPAPTQPSAQAPAVDPKTGTPTAEAFRFLVALLAYAKALEARIAILEARP